MFIHGIVHYMTYADGEWWHDRDPKPQQLWGRGHRVHRLDEGADCLLEWGASFPKGEHKEQMESQRFEGEVPNLDLTVDSTQGRDGFIDDPYVPGDQGYCPLPRREHARQSRTQSPARDTSERAGSAKRPGTSLRVELIPGKVISALQRVAAGAGGGPEPPPNDKLCDHCLQVTPRPCPRYDEHDTHECPCDHRNLEREKEKHEQWRRQWKSVFERKQRWLDEWENWLRNYFADLAEMWQKDELPMFVPSIAKHRELMKSVIPAVEQLPLFQPLSSAQHENVEAWHRRHVIPPTERGVPGEYLPERKPQWEKPRAAYVGMPFQPTSATEQRRLLEEQDAALAADLQAHEDHLCRSRPRLPPLQGSPQPTRDRPPECPVRSSHPPTPTHATSVHQHSMLEETVQQLAHINQNFCTTIEQQQAQFNRLLREGRPLDKSKTPSITGQDRQTGLRFWLDAIPHFDGKKCEDFFEWISKIEDAARQAANSTNDQHWTEYCIATLKARGSVFTHLKAKSDATPWTKLKEGLQMEFSSLPTMIDAINALEERTQGPHETLDEYTQEFFRLNCTVHGTLPSHTQNKHIFNKYICGLHEPELLHKCTKQQGSFDNLHDVATYAKLQSQKLRMQDMTVSCAPMQDSIMPLQESPRQTTPNQNRNANNQDSSGGFATTPVPRVTPFTFY